MGDCVRRRSSFARRGGRSGLEIAAKKVAESSKYRIDDVLVGAGAAFHVDMRLFVGGAPLVEETLESRFGIAVPELGSGVPARGPLGQNIDWGVEPDRDRPVIEKLSGTRIDISAASGRDHSDSALIDQSRDEAPFAIAKIVFAIALENFCGRKACGVLDRRVAVDELQAEALCKAPADGGFSYSHQPHQHDRPIEALAEFYHLGGYTAAHPLGKSARMSRIAVLIILLVVIVGALFFLSRVPKAQPTHTIEVTVPQGGNAH